MIASPAQQPRPQTAPESSSLALAERRRSRWRDWGFPWSWRAAARVVGITTGIWLLVASITLAQTWWMGVRPLAAAVQIGVIEWSPWVLLSPLIVLLAAVAPIGRATWKWAAPLHLACSLGVAIAVNGLTAIVARIALPGPGAAGTFFVATPNAGGRTAIEVRPDILIGPPLARGHGPAPFPGERVPGPILARRVSMPGVWLIGARLTLPIYWLIVVAVHAWRHHRIALERESRAVRAERELVRARLAALQSQLQPHFLFNSLNAVSAFIAKRPAVAESMVCALSDLLRLVLGMSDRPEIPLREELDFARRYLAVHRIRFGDALQISWRVEPEALEAMVPTLLLQPLIENALDHGLAGAPGELEILAAAQRDRLLLSVTNRLHAPPRLPAARGPGSRIGLRNTRARLETLFGAASRLELREIPGGARAEIELPLRCSAV